jgi:hypothetical protein
MKSNSHHQGPAGGLILTTPQELARLIDAALERAMQRFHPARHSPESERYLATSESTACLNLARQAFYSYTSSRTIPFIKKAKRRRPKGRKNALPHSYPAGSTAKWQGSAPRIIAFSPGGNHPGSHD